MDKYLAHCTAHMHEEVLLLVGVSLYYKPGFVALLRSLFVLNGEETLSSYHVGVGWQSRPVQDLESPSFELLRHFIFLCCFKV